MNETEEQKIQNEDKEDNFSDIDENENSFEVNVNLIKNSTTTSNFKFDINIANNLQEKPKKEIVNKGLSLLRSNLINTKEE